MGVRFARTYTSRCVLKRLSSLQNRATASLAVSRAGNVTDVDLIPSIGDEMVGNQSSAMQPQGPVDRQTASASSTLRDPSAVTISTPATACSPSGSSDSSTPTTRVFSSTVAPLLLLAASTYSPGVTCAVSLPSPMDRTPAPFPSSQFGVPRMDPNPFLPSPATERTGSLRYVLSPHSAASSACLSNA
jgi:hypothetical protein